jgi:glucan phosphoethanolaminetransferase (alkaline phosphatase superfamily)
MLYALGQSFMEVCFFALIACLLKEWAFKWIFYSFIGLSFTALLAHYVDFTLLRLMDTSFSYLFPFFFGSGFHHLKTAFLALNMNQAMIALIFGSVIAIPLLGIGLYSWTHTWALKKPWKLSLKQLSGFLALIGSCLFLLDLAAYPRLNRLAYYKYEKALPLGMTFLSPEPKYHQLKDAIAMLPPEEAITLRVNELNAAKTALPNIYFFIIETLRKDFITPEIAPVLSNFEKNNITFPQTFANSNYSNLCWYALLHSNSPLHWTTARDSYKEGSPALRLLKKLGYKTRVYSSADLSYFNMQKVLFGKQNQLIDHLEQYTDQRDLEPCDRDALAIKAFERDLDQNPQSTVYLFFFDSTHSEYSFPKNFPLKFHPISKQISYLTISRSNKELELLKNRYRNSIAYVDSLLEKFFFLLHKKGLYEESIIAITGDHGEEFFEENSLFHGTHLNHYQTAVPIACKFQGNEWKARIDPQRNLMSHIDLFPSIIHYVIGSETFTDLFDGQSIFTPQSQPYHLSVLQNGAQAPIEFTLDWGNEIIKARICTANTLEILNSSNPSESFIEYHADQALKSLKLTKTKSTNP